MDEVSNDENGNPKTDPLNPNEELRERPRMGMVMMKSFHIKVIMFGIMVSCMILKKVRLIAENAH